MSRFLKIELPGKEGEGVDNIDFIHALKKLTNSQIMIKEFEL